MGIKHRADSGFRKFLALSKLCLAGQVWSSEMPDVSYPKPHRPFRPHRLPALFQPSVQRYPHSNKRALVTDSQRSL